MALTGEEKFKAFMSKDITTKTLLVSMDELEQVIKEHEDEGWKLVKQTEVNGRMKATFQKVK